MLRPLLDLSTACGMIGCLIYFGLPDMPLPIQALLGASYALGVLGALCGVASHTGRISSDCESLEEGLVKEEKGLVKEEGLVKVGVCFDLLYLVAFKAYFALTEQGPLHPVHLVAFLNSHLTVACLLYWRFRLLYLDEE